ncbi:AbrB family transcriptional regulator [Corynebacterium mayonis]|uniref:AbrB family transcriptional regulator n=1 Tax=Corynebacterium mayonis TaxID=3062461 RepID=UPI003140C364
MNRWLIVAPSSVALGWIFNRAHVPAAWILAAIICSSAAALLSGRDLKVNDTFYSACRGIIGVLAAMPLVGVPLGDLVRYVVPGLVVAAVTNAVAVGGGWVLSRHSDLSRETGVLAMLAGGASVIPAIAQDLGADMKYVALTQYLRLLVVSMTLPVAASFLVTPQQIQQQAPEQFTQWWMWPLVLLIALGGGPVAKKLRIPVPSVFGPLLVTVVLGTFSPVALATPEALAVLAFLAIGWVCGGGLSVPSLRVFARQLPLTIAYIAVVMAACAGMGWVVARWLGISFFEGYLATSPGALETVLALSAEGGAGPAVIALQLIRLVSVLLVAGYLPVMLRRRR